VEVPEVEISSVPETVRPVVLILVAEKLETVEVPEPVKSKVPVEITSPPRTRPDFTSRLPLIN